jgi:protease PrsW
MPFILSVLLGFVPMLLFAGFVNWLDRYEKEPKLLLGVVFFWGAIVAAGAAFLVNTVLGLGIYIFTGSDAATTFATGSLIAPVVEEILKGMAVLLVFLVFRREFDSVLDGIIYAAIVALGFAATENVYYIFVNGYLSGEGGVWEGWSGLWLMAFIRIILVGWQHPFYTAFFGIGLAVGRVNRNLLIKIAAPLIGLILAMFAHGLHNTISPLLVGYAGIGGLFIGSFLDWMGWMMMFIFTILMVFSERRLLQKYLQDEIMTGNLTQQQYQTAISLFGQGVAKLKAIFAGRWRVTGRFYQLCGELAHKKNQYARLGEEKGNSAIITRLRLELAQLSSKI